MTEPTYANETRARALLELCHPLANERGRRPADRIAKARAVVAGFDLVAESLGAHTAAWAYADNRTPGTAAARALGAWDERGPLILSGITGSSKTTSAARYVAEQRGGLIRADAIGRWSYEGTGPDEFAAYLRAPILLIDDLGTEQTKGRGPEHLVSLISTRADHGRPTVMTTMLTEDVFVGRYSAQVASRCAGGFVTLADTDDLRLGGAVAELVELGRQRKLAWMGAVVASIADRITWGPRAAHTLTEFTGLLLDLGFPPAAIEAKTIEVDARERAAAVEADRHTAMWLKSLGQSPVVSADPVALPPIVVSHEDMKQLDDLGAKRERSRTKEPAPNDLPLPR